MIQHFTCPDNEILASLTDSIWGKIAGNNTACPELKEKDLIYLGMAWQQLRTQGHKTALVSPRLKLYFEWHKLYIKQGKTTYSAWLPGLAADRLGLEG